MATEFIPIAMAQLWQVTLLILVVAAMSRWLSARRPHLSHLLWLVVLIKCVTPPLWASPGGVFCWLQPEQQIETPFVDNVEWTPVAWDEMLEVDNTSLVNAEVSDTPFAGVYLDETAAAELTADLNVVEPASDEPSTGWLGDAAFVAWAAISGFVLLGVTIRWLRFWSLVRASPRRDSPELDAMLRALSKQLGVRRRVRLIVTESLVGPAVVGFFRVTVLIPAVVADKLKGKSVEPILAHELLHIRRGDLWVGLLQTVAQALWWFHPLVWWVGRATSREAERCCDEEVLGELKCDPASYARALLDVLDLKSQLKPVPVFPGVRPVDVTSQRLERIMTLRQGCRRRSPWWCWLVAIGAAALTLPGAAFVVTAQEESSKPTANEESSALPARPAYVGPGPFPPMPLPQDKELHAYAFGVSDNSPTTEVYDITEFMPLLSGSESEQHQKFERLVRSRDAARDAQINWFNNQPVVKTTPVGHAAVRQCIDLLVGSDATSETIDAFLESVSKQLEATLVCDLQVISVSDDAFSKLEDVASDHSVETPWVIPADKWEEAIRSINRDETFLFLAPKCAVLNGRSVMVESVAEHPVSLRLEDDGSLIPGANWSGWKTQLLPFVREDGSFWLGLSFENGKVVEAKTLTAEQKKQVKADGPATVHSYQHLKFSTTLKEGQIVVLPGFETAHGDETSRATIITARVRRLSDKASPKAVRSPRPISGTGVKSDAGIEGSVVLDAQVASDQESKATTARSKERSGKLQEPRDATNPLASQISKDGHGRLFKQHGPFRVEVGLSPEYQARLTPGSSVPWPTNMQITLSRSAEAGKESSHATGRRLDMRADQNSFRDKNGTLTLMLKGNVELHAGDSSSDKAATFFTATADLLEISIPESRNTDIVTSVSCRMTEATVRYGVGGEAGPSMISAEDITVELDAETFGVASLNASKVDSLQVSDVKQKAARSPLVFAESRELLSQWDTIRRRRSYQKLVSPDFDQTPLKDAIAWFRESANLNIVIDEPSIEEEGIRTTTPVTMQLKDVRVDSALRLLLQRFKLGVMVDEESGVVIVTSQFHMKGKMIAAAYPVAGLVIQNPKAIVVRLSDATSSTPQIDPDGIQLASNLTRSRPQLDFHTIGELITTVVEPDSWQEVGGRGTLRMNETTLSLVIRQTQDVHREISDLLDQLRRLQEIQVSLEMETLELPKAFLDEWDGDLEFKPFTESKLHRYVRLSGAQADELRKAGKSSLFPKVTLFNGQLCELRMDEQDGIKQNWHVQPAVSGDRRSVRLGVGIDDGRSGTFDEAVPTSVTTVSDGGAILVEVDGSTEKNGRIVGEPIPGQPRAFRRVSQPRHFVLIQPKVVMVEEEEELLSIDTEQ